MMKAKINWLAALLLSLSSLAAQGVDAPLPTCPAGNNCGGMGMGMGGMGMGMGGMGMGGMGMGGMGGMSGMSMLRHRHVMARGLDPLYAQRTLSVRPGEEALRAGQRLFEQNCVVCHGAGGRGDGVAAAGLNPPPANIAAFAKMGMATDGYLLWTLSEGGAPIGSAMPPFKGSLSADAMSQVILYLRAMQ